MFVPTTAPSVKVERLRSDGAEIVMQGGEYAAAYEAALEYAGHSRAVHCHAYDQPEIAAGAGTLGLEILGEVDAQVDTVIVAVGGGGLMAGVAAAVEGTARVVGVEPATIPTLRRALDNGGPVDVSVSGVAVDSLGARRLGHIAYEVATRTQVQSLLVTDGDIIAARHILWDETEWSSSTRCHGICRPHVRRLRTCGRRARRRRAVRSQHQPRGPLAGATPGAIRLAPAMGMEPLGDWCADRGDPRALATGSPSKPRGRCSTR